MFGAREVHRDVLHAPSKSTVYNACVADEIVMDTLLWCSIDLRLASGPWPWAWDLRRTRAKSKS